MRSKSKQSQTQKDKNVSVNGNQNAPLAAIKREDLLIKQYEIFSNQRRHFGSLFWQIPALFLGICALIGNMIKDARGDLRWALLLTAGALLVLISYVACRMRINEDIYENLMQNIEMTLRDSGCADFKVAPRSKRVGARSAAIIAYALLGFSLAVVSIVNLLR